MNAPSFEISFSYPAEHPIPLEGIDEDAFILYVEGGSGDVYEFTVWTEAYLARSRQRDQESGACLSGQYLLLPDLVVASHDVDLIERIVADLIRTNRLREAWHIPDELTASWSEDGPIPDDKDDSDAYGFVVLGPDAEQICCGCCHMHPAA